MAGRQNLRSEVRKETSLDDFGASLVSLEALCGAYLSAYPAHSQAHTNRKNDFDMRIWVCASMLSSTPMVRRKRISDVLPMFFIHGWRVWYGAYPFQMFYRRFLCIFGFRRPLPLL